MQWECTVRVGSYKEVSLIVSRHGICAAWLYLSQFIEYRHGGEVDEYRNHQLEQLLRENSELEVGQGEQKDLHPNSVPRPGIQNHVNIRESPIIGVPSTRRT